MPSSCSSIGCGRISRGTIWRMLLANSAVATAATARRDRRSVLAQRLISAVVLIPLVLAGVWLGSPYLEALVAAFGAAMAWEWSGLCARGGAGAVAVVGVLTVLGAVAASFAASFGLAFALVAVGGVAMAAAPAATGA